MAVNYVIEGFKFLGEGVCEFCKKNKAHIFTAAGIGGTIATGILGARDGAKAARKIDQKAYELQRPLSTKEKIQLCWKDYIDVTAVGALACFSEFKSDQINTRTIADRTALLVASEKAYERLSQKTKEVLGEKKAAQVKDEVAKEKIEESKISTNRASFDGAPRSGNGDLHPFVDGYSNLLFWSNIDYVNTCVMKLREMMAELRPRNDSYDLFDKKIGISYSEWLSMIGFDKNVYSATERKDAGWNKGYAKDGCEDDPIEIYTTTMEWEPGFAVTVINWEKDPTDMKLGRILKTNNL